MIAHLIKTSTLWEFVNAHWLTATRHAELVSASYSLIAGKSKTLKRVQGDIVGIVKGDVVGIAQGELRGVNA